MQTERMMWLDFGESDPQFLDYIGGLWDTIQVTITSDDDYKVYWHGGTDFEPRTYRLKCKWTHTIDLTNVWSYEHCGSWYDVLSWFSTPDVCSLKVSYNVLYTCRGG